MSNATDIIILKQGAEARLYISEFNSQKCLVKERFRKTYRLPEIDKQLSGERMKAESKAISRCQAAGILVPRIYNMNLNDRKIYMEYFDRAVTAKTYINDLSPENEEQLNRIGEMIGSIVGKMHANNIIHGDLTTSNILLNPKSDDIHDYDMIFIDFGLAHYGQSTEDKGVDLYVLERALLSAHSSVPTIFDIILQSYKLHNSNGAADVISKFEDVRARGRKRTMVG
ncbi:EKC/KEOPS complex subunit bud32 [Pseudolycoriella hygida]|uniref:non-specific serine/threonine protein kinase n=1 Tax=Pseudolycoriella hygida TaxID=35572 RepID=A0A9Q0RUX2_9DIPT|nr:EKC/KEOPS complex subunit bud32 [Pseudolycoriella hygida]